ncbi:MAG: hypothetical protein ACYDBB_10500 [Armatimonadota bacterium]
MNRLIHISLNMLFLVLASLCAISVVGCSDSSGNNSPTIPISINSGTPAPVIPGDSILTDNTIPQPGEGTSPGAVMPSLTIGMDGYSVDADSPSTAPAFLLAAVQENGTTIPATQPLGLATLDNELSTSKAVLPLGTNTLSLAPGTTINVNSLNLSMTRTATRGKARQLEITLFDIKFDVLPGGQWTLPTNGKLYLQQTSNNKVTFTDSGLILTWASQVGAIIPSDAVAKIDVILYDGAQKVFEGHKTITIQNAMAHFTSLSRVPFTRAEISLDIRNHIQ